MCFAVATQIGQDREINKTYTEAELAAGSCTVENKQQGMFTHSVVQPKF
jgi:hypothetical protein